MRDRGERNRQETHLYAPASSQGSVPTGAPSKGERAAPTAIARTAPVSRPTQRGRRGKAPTEEGEALLRDKEGFLEASSPRDIRARVPGLAGLAGIMRGRQRKRCRGVGPEGVASWGRPTISGPPHALPSTDRSRVPAARSLARGSMAPLGLEDEGSSIRQGSRRRCPTDGGVVPWRLAAVQDPVAASAATSKSSEIAQKTAKKMKRLRKVLRTSRLKNGTVAEKTCATGQRSRYSC